MATQVLKIVIKVVDKARAGLKRMQESTNIIDKNLKKVNRKAVQFLGLGLGMLFAGMALQKFFGGFLRAAFNTFTKIVDVQDEAFQQVQHLRAAWEFLKFAMIDALLSSDIILILIDNVIALIDILGQLPKETIAKIGKIAIVGFAAATAMLILGQVFLFMIGIAGALNIGLGLLIRSLFLIVAIWAIWKSDLTKVEKGLLLVGIALGIVAVALFKVFGVSVLAFAVPILLIAGIAIALALLSVKFGGLGNAIKVWGLGILTVLKIIADGVYEFLIFPFQLAAKGIIAMMVLARRNVPQSLVDFAGFKMPNVAERLAELSTQLQPMVVEEKPIGAIFEGIGEKIFEGLGDFANKMIDGVNDKLEETIENQNLNVGEQTQDMGGFIEEQTTKLDETMNQIVEGQKQLVDILQNDAVIVPTTQG